MPAELLTPEEKKRYYDLRGLSPDEWDLAGDLSFVPKGQSTKTQPTSAANQTTTGPFEALGIAAKNQTGPMLVGLPLMSAGAGLGTLTGPLAPIASPVLSIAGLLGGGGIGRGAQEYLEPKLRGESEQETAARLQKEALAGQEHPWMSLLGGTLPLGIGFKAATPDIYKAAGSGLAKLLPSATPKVAEMARLLPGEKAALSLLGGNVAIGTGLPLGEAAYEGGKEAYKKSGSGIGDVLSGALSGAANVDKKAELAGLVQGLLLGEPRALTKRLMPFTPHTPVGYRYSGEKSRQGIEPEYYDPEAEAAKQKTVDPEELAKQNLVPDSDPRIRVAAEREALYNKELARAKKENENKLALEGGEPLAKEDLASIAQKRADDAIAGRLKGRKEVDLVGKEIQTSEQAALLEKTKAKEAEIKSKTGQEKFDIASNDQSKVSFLAKDEEGNYVRTPSDVKTQVKTFLPGLLRDFPAKPHELGDYPYSVKLPEDTLRELLDNRLFGSQEASGDFSRFTAEENAKNLQRRMEEEQSYREMAEQRAQEEADKSRKAERKLAEEQAKLTGKPLAPEKITLNKQAQMPTVSTDLRQLQKKIKGNQLGGEPPAGNVRLQKNRYIDELQDKSDPHVYQASTTEKTARDPLLHSLALFKDQRIFADYNLAKDPSFHKKAVEKAKLNLIRSVHERYPKTTIDDFQHLLNSKTESEAILSFDGIKNSEQRSRNQQTPVAKPLAPEPGTTIVAPVELTPLERRVKAGEGVPKVTYRRTSIIGHKDYPLGNVDPATREQMLGSNRDETTSLHEDLHLRVLDIQRDPEASKTAKELVKRGMELSGESDAVLQDEALVKHGAKRAVELAEARETLGGRFKAYWKDFARLHRFAKNTATFKDIQHLLGRRLLDDPNYYESGLAARDLKNVIYGPKQPGTVVEEKQQENPYHSGPPFDPYKQHRQFETMNEFLAEAESGVRDRPSNQVIGILRELHRESSTQEEFNKKVVAIFNDPVMRRLGYKDVKVDEDSNVLFLKHKDSAFPLSFNLHSPDTLEQVDRTPAGQKIITVREQAEPYDKSKPRPGESDEDFAARQKIEGDLTKVGGPLEEVGHTTKHPDFNPEDSLAAQGITTGEGKKIADPSSNSGFEFDLLRGFERFKEVRKMLEGENKKTWENNMSYLLEGEAELLKKNPVTVLKNIMLQKGIDSKDFIFAHKPGDTYNINLTDKTTGRDYNLDLGPSTTSQSPGQPNPYDIEIADEHGNPFPTEEESFSKEKGLPAQKEDTSNLSPEELKAYDEANKNKFKFQKDPYTKAETEAQRLKSGRNIWGLERLLEPIASKVSMIDNGANDSANYVADRFRKFFFNKDLYTGPYMGVPTKEMMKYSPEVQNSVYEKLRAENRNGKAERYTLEEKPLADFLRKNFIERIRDDQNARGILVSGRKGGKYPFYFPAEMGQKQFETMTQYPGSQKAKDFEQDIINQWVNESGETPAKVEEWLNNYLNAKSGAGEASTTELEFNALRRARGFGLPESVIEKNLFNAVVKYGRRVANDFAFFDSIQSQPKALAILGLPDQHGVVPNAKDLGVENLASHKYVETAVETMTGRRDNNSPIISSLVNAVHSGLFGIPVGVRDVVTIPSTVLPYGGFRSAVGDLMKATGSAFDKDLIQRHAIESGSVKHRPQERFYGENLNDRSYNIYAEQIHKLADFIYTAQQRGKIENAGRYVSQSLGELWVDRTLRQAQEGNGPAKDVLTEFGKPALLDESKLSDSIAKKTPLDEDTRLRLVKEFVNRTQQSYNANDLPAWALNGPFAPFFRIARWSIGKQSMFIKDVIGPARKGNYGPLISSTLGGLLTGTAIYKLNTYMNAKKDYNPSPEEIASEQSKWGPRIDGIINLAQLGSYAGFLGDTFKIISNITQGQAPRGYSSPTINAISETFLTDLPNLFKAVNEGEDKIPAFLAFANKLISEHVQTYRILANHLWKGDENERKAKFRDLSVFNRLTDNKQEGGSATYVPTTNPFSKKGEREFKQTADVDKAQGLLGELLDKASMKYEDDPEKLLKYLRGLKENSYQTMPKPEVGNLKEFDSYYRFLVETQGKKAADDRVEDYMTQNAINRAKSSMVP